MTVKILPSVPKGKVQVPPSKSLAHRMLICAAFSDGESRIRNIGDSDDVKATVRCLEAFGVKIRIENGDAFVRGTDIDKLNNDGIPDCGESASTLRFLIPVCLLCGKEISFRCGNSLEKRPVGIYENLCREKGLTFNRNGNTITVKGPLRAGEFTLSGNVSSQFISGLLLALPLAEGDSIIRVTDSIESKAYIDMTAEVLSLFGVEIKREGNDFYIRGGGRYKSCDVSVSADFSSAAYLSAFNCVGGETVIENTDERYSQADAVYPSLFEKILKGQEADISDCPDLGPVLFALAALNNGGRITGVSRLRLKESDRIDAMAKELAKVGAVLEAEENSVRILPCPLHSPTEPFDGHNDHRIVMAMSLVGSVTGGEIRNAQTVSKSFPSFFDTLASLDMIIQISV